MKELFIFDRDDNLLTILSEETGLIDTLFKDYENEIVDETFVFNVDNEVRYSQGYSNVASEYHLTQVAGSFIGTIDDDKDIVHTDELVSPIEFIEEENQVAFYDKDNALRLMRIKELYEETNHEGSTIKVVCEPAFLELYDNFIEDRRFTDRTAQFVLDAALEGSRYVGEVTVELGKKQDNFYWINSIDAIWKILKKWGGALKDTITLDDNNNIIERKIMIVERLGSDKGLIVEPDYNAETISRNSLSYVETALWAQGASLELEDEEGNLTGGHSRYITFEDVEWKVSNGDPVDKPLGQKWVGDPQALAEYGYLHDGERKHRFGHFSNQDYETPEELLEATWQELQERKVKEIIHEAKIYEDVKGVSLGDTVTIISREYSKPIEIQSQITGLEYDILDDEEINIIIGKYVDMNKDPLEAELDEVKKNQDKPVKIGSGNFADIKPAKVTNLEATGGFQTVMLHWEYESKVYIAEYEVYASQNIDFVPDSQFLAYRGRVSAFSHEVETNQTWHYYVRAINHAGTAGEFSDIATASTVRLKLTETEFKEELEGAVDSANNAMNRADEAFTEAGNSFDLANQAVSDASNSFDLANQAMGIADTNKNSIITLKEEDGMIYQRIESVNTRLDNMDGDDRNLITHLPQNWEQGSIINGVNDLDGNLRYIRTVGYVNIHGDTEYTLTSYGDYVIKILFYNDEMFLNEFEEALENTNVTFTTPINANRARIIIWVTSGEIDPDMVGTDLKIKMQSGNNSTDWSPNFNDTGELVNNVQSFVHEFEQKSDSMIRRISDNEGNISSITQLSNGLQTSVSGLRDDIDNIEIGGVNLVGSEPRHWGGTNDSEFREDGSIYITNPRQVIWGNFVSNEEIELETGESIVYSFYVIDYKGSVGVQLRKTSGPGSAPSYASEYINSTGYFEQKYTNEYSESVFFKPWITLYADDPGNDGTQFVHVKEIQVEKGKYRTAYSPFAKEIATTSQLTILKDTINGRVSDVEGNVSNLTLTTQGLQSQVTDNEGSISTLTQIADGLRLEVGKIPNDNLISHNVDNWTNVFMANFSDIQVDKKGVRYTFTNHSKLNVTEASIRLFNQHGVILFTYHAHNKGDSITFDIGNYVTRVEIMVLVDDNDFLKKLGSEYIFKLEEGEVSTGISTLSKDVYSQYTQLDDMINLRVAKGDVINQINISEEGTLIDGNNLHITADTYIDNAVIRTGHIFDGSITNAKIKNAAIDDAKISDLSATKITAGTIDASKVKIHGGSSIDYTKIDGSRFESRGRFTRTWRGVTETHDIKMIMENGYLRARNDSKNYSLYFSDMGISTFADGSGEEGLGKEWTSGTLAFRDEDYSTGGDRKGVTLLSTFGSPALESGHNSVYIAPNRENRSGANYFSFTIKANDSYNDTDGWIGFGEMDQHSKFGGGLRFSKGINKNTIYATNRYGDIDTGNFQAYEFIGKLATINGTIRVRGANSGIIANTIRLDVNSNATNFYIGVSGGEARVTNNNLSGGSSDPSYRPIRASNFYQSSSEDYKENIRDLGDKALEVINKLKVVEFDYKDDPNKNCEVGLIAEDSPELATDDGKAISLNKQINYLTKSVQELYTILEKQLGVDNNE